MKLKYFQRKSKGNSYETVLKRDEQMEMLKKQLQLIIEENHMLVDLISKRGHTLKNSLPQIIDFLTYSSKFEEIKSSLERKSEKDRTKEDVDLYNNMVKEINKKINDYNKLNSENVTSKNKQIGEWNIASEKYISRHVPND